MNRFRIWIPIMLLIAAPAVLRAENASEAVSPSNSRPSPPVPNSGPADRSESERAEQEIESARRELKLQNKEAELEKERALLQEEEARLARKEAEIIGRSEENREKLAEARARALKEEAEARLAREKVRLAEGRVRTAEERIRLAGEKSEEARIRASESQHRTYRRIMLTIIILLVGYLLLFILVKVINSQIDELRVRHILRKNVIYFVNLLIIIFVLFIWFQHIGSLTIFLSAVGAGVALALQEVILSVAGWFVLLIKRPFEVGDRIEYGGVKGDVIDIRILQTSLLEIGNWVEADQSTGRIVHIPNSEVFKKVNFNYSRGFEFIWNEIKVLFTFESDWKRAEEIMLSRAGKKAEGMEAIVKRKIKRMSRRYMIHYGKLTPIVYVKIKDSGVELTLRYLTEARKRRGTEDEFSRLILEDFKKEESVNFAYTTYRIVK